jgi:iron(III) transport system substrate-binding protein
VNKRFVALAVAAAITITGCGQAASPAPSAGASGSATSSVYEAAKKEGQLTVNTHDPDQEAQAVAAFNGRYPGIKITWLTGRGTDIAEKVKTEAANKVYNLDVLDAGSQDTAGLKDEGLTEPYQSPELANVRPEFRDPEGAVNPQYVQVYGIVINTKLVPAGSEPKSWTDLLDPKWKGQIAMQDPRGTGGTMSLLTAFSKDSGLGIEYVKKLAQQDVFMGRETQQLLTDTIRGEHAIQLGVSSANFVLEKEKNSAVPIKWIKPTEGESTSMIWLSLVKNAPHPNAARLWVDWRLSDEGQTALGKEGQAAVRTGVKTPFDEGNVDGVRIMYLQTNQDVVKIKEYSQMWDDIFFKK